MRHVISRNLGGLDTSIGPNTDPDPLLGLDINRGPLNQPIEAVGDAGAYPSASGRAIKHGKKTPSMGVTHVGVKVGSPKARMDKSAAAGPRRNC